MCLFTSARTVAIVCARSAGSEAMYCSGVLTFDGGFMDSSSSRTECITKCLKTGQKQGLSVSRTFQPAQASQVTAVHHSDDSASGFLNDTTCPMTGVRIRGRI